MTIYKNISGNSFEIIESLPNKQCLVRFIETGSIVKCWRANVYQGKVADPYQKSRLGIGYLGHYRKDDSYKQALQLWSNMLKRCYDPNDKRGYYGKGVNVDPSWHCFATFQEEIKNLKGYKNWFNKEKFELDKDLLGDGKTYSKETCWFIPAALNKSAGKLGKIKVDGQWVTTTV